MVLVPFVVDSFILVQTEGHVNGHVLFTRCRKQKALIPDILVELPVTSLNQEYFRLKAKAK